MVSVFDMNLAYYYIENGVRPLYPPRVHRQSNKVFFVFSKEDTQELYNKYSKEHYIRK